MLLFQSSNQIDIVFAAIQIQKFWRPKHQHSSCQKEDEENQRRNLPPAQLRLDCSSLWDVSTVTSSWVATARGLEAELLCTWLLSWSTCALRCSSSLETLLATTRSPGSHPVTWHLLSAMTRSSTSSLAESPSRTAVCCRTFTLFCCQRSLARARRSKSKSKHGFFQSQNEV